MLEHLKSQVLIAYQELSRYGLDNYARGSVSAIDRESGIIVMKSAKDAFVVDMHGTILEGSSTPSSRIFNLSISSLERPVPSLVFIAAIS